ncbi:ABC transporter ATP-binding protein [Mesorhizobium sp. VK23B]|uniref:ABC transporter ATP-binding protein n=1 Tax=Mesorhizobium dulcispinae TaxID=3072316 RepID=A0ABU4XJU0_9HYPH|nr:MULTISPECIES: ABC transporter ATP-binding protein [unclassified Mesorhizobium]MDX8468626.1 ABC transporter ATP-binding protein [Mesorhizobium sp. VK23B]MDX8475033.1 ABC transporter ATP-binding protein [Mesorhizobium sp. VK23A]MDX8520405.1 ABC transporter ATP-binding protein [Mesorhizobium sp. VK23D]
MSTLIETSRLTRILPETVPVTLVEDISLRIDEKEFVAITGPSGSGKSSLLYLLGLLDRPTSGRLTIAGRDSGPMDEKERARTRLEMMGFVFQFHFLLPEFTARENVEIPMRKLGRLARDEMHEHAGDLLGSLGLGEYLDQRPDQLSGGQRQRVAVARALANDPPLILADEPTGSLDSKSSEQVFEILQNLVRERGKAVVAVTHDLDMAARMQRRIHIVDGKIT